jgi:deazaflavin-dependent oxidoreductase (nitroreductase family)
MSTDTGSPTPEDRPPEDLPAQVWGVTGDAERPGGGAGRVREVLARVRGRPWYRKAGRAPMWLWRLGLGPLVGQGFALLTTTGRRSGLPRTTMVAYLRGQERLYVVAVYGPGSQWFRNLVADPRVNVQTARGSQAMLARRLTSDEDLRRAYTELRGRLDGLVDVGLAALGAPGGLQGLLDHREQILLVGLDPVGTPAPRAVTPDLWWVLPAAGLLWILRRRRRSARGSR